MIKSGQTVNNRYLLKEKLGDGAASHVWKVLDLNNKKDYALKIYKSYKNNNYDGELKTLLWLREKRVDSSQLTLYHDNFAISNFSNKLGGNDFNLNKFMKSSSTTHPCLVIDLCGSPFYKVFKVFPKLRAGTVDNIMTQVIKGLSILHKYSIVHNDMSLNNILLTKPLNQIITEDDISVVLSDYDHSYFSGVLSQKQYKYADTTGTYNYRAPEKIINSEYNHKADIWALGCCLFEIITGEYLFDYDDESDESAESKEYSNSSEMSECSNIDSDVSNDSNASSRSSGSDDSEFSEDLKIKYNECYELLLMIEKIIGKPPKSFTEKGREYYNKKGHLKDNSDVDKIDFDSFFKDYGFGPKHIEAIKKIFKWNYKERPECDDLLKYFQ